MTAARVECARVLAEIEAFVDGALDSVECDDIERHCEGCDPCAAIVRGVRQTIGLCREVGRAPLPESVSDRARAQVKRLLESSRITREH